MKLIDAQFMEAPFYGRCQMARHLRSPEGPWPLWGRVSPKDGYCVGRKRVRRLMAIMGLSAVFQRPRTTVPHPEHRKYPCLLRDLMIERPNQVWRVDITYSPMRRIGHRARTDGASMAHSFGLFALIGEADSRRES